MTVKPAKKASTLKMTVFLQKLGYPGPERKRIVISAKALGCLQLQKPQLFSQGLGGGQLSSD